MVATDGSIDWACLRRFDAPAIFARLLGSDAGHWQIAPPDAETVHRAYLTDTMVLRTEFHTPTGSAALTDAMALGLGEHGHRIGHRSPHVIVRRVEGLDGDVEMTLEFVLRPEYGLTVPVMIADDHGLRSHGGPFSFRLWSPVPIHARDGDGRATFRIRRGESVYFGLTRCSSWPDDVEPVVGPHDLPALLDATIAGWRSWSELHQAYDGPYADDVRLSGRILQALTYAPTGAVVAAATTSLPETIGGDRNWDYRFCWVRDASLTLEALWVAACPDEAGHFFDFLSTAAGGSLRSGSDLQILYGVGGERLVPEHELPHLEGFANSRPVRIGNGAWNQTQLDVYGELLSAACLLADEIDGFDELTAQFLVDVADAAAARWVRADQGIWEVRGEPRHFVHSKLMCWVALDRAVQLAARLGAEDRLPRWRVVRDEIRVAIEKRGWSERAQAFTQTFESEDLDASVLLIFLTGFIGAEDPRMRATVETIAAGLSDERGFVYRYRAPDGLKGDEGTFAICTFWLIQCFAHLGDVARARELFERMTAHANDVGLLSEEIDPGTGALLGNFPQAFTHVGLVNAAWAIAVAEGDDSAMSAIAAKRRPASPRR